MGQAIEITKELEEEEGEIIFVFSACYWYRMSSVYFRRRSIPLSAPQVFLLLLLLVAGCRRKGTLFNSLFMSIIFSFFPLWMKEGRYGCVSGSRGNERENAGTLVNFFWEKKLNCVCVFVRAHSPRNKTWGYIHFLFFSVQRGGKTELNREWPFVGHCWKKNRIARTNTWTSLEKGQNKGKYDVDV